MTSSPHCQLSQLSQDSIYVRDLQPSDLSEVLVIERNVQSSPWGRISFEESLAREHICRAIINREASPNALLAFHVVCPVADELHILNLAVAKSCQGQGLAHYLMQDIIDIAQNNAATKKIFLEVRAGNEVAQKLYQKWRFEQIAFRKNYYRTQTKEREDALVFLRRV